MAYNKKELYSRAMKVIETKNPIWIEELSTLMAIDKSTFYRYFPSGSSEYNELKEKIDDNRIKVKGGLRRQWFEPGSSPALQIALYKLMGSEEEVERLNGSKQKVDVTSDGEKITGFNYIIPIKNANNDSSHE